MAALVAVAAIGLTYLVCVRPMLGGRGHCGMPAGVRHDESTAGVTKREIAEMREELRILRAQDQLRRQEVPPADR